MKRQKKFICDRCGKENLTFGDWVQMRMVDDDRAPYHVDVCKTCWASFEDWVDGKAVEAVK